uniref:Uncharacterized protein n=1 Tax=Avena sativa TaxID=4498 RepID=A0ACD5W4Y4_AVESA
MGVDLEQAAGPAYRAIPADPHDEAPVLGDAPRAPTPKEDWRLFPIALIISLVVMVVMLGPVEYLVQTNLASFSVGLAGHDGVDVARPASVVSPAFNITLRMSKACADRAEVVLTYSGVALGWARVEPRGCASREPWGRDVELVTRADGVGLSRSLRERMAAEWRRLGRLELDADVVIYTDRRPLSYLGDDTRDKVMRCKVVMADGLQPEPEPCPWYYLRPYSYDKFELKTNTNQEQKIIRWKNVLPPFQNIRSFSFVKQMYLDYI